MCFHLAKGRKKGPFSWLVFLFLGAGRIPRNFLEESLVLNLLNLYQLPERVTLSVQDVNIVYESDFMLFGR